MSESCDKFIQDKFSDKSITFFTREVTVWLSSSSSYLSFSSSSSSFLLSFFFLNDLRDEKRVNITIGFIKSYHKHNPFIWHRMKIPHASTEEHYPIIYENDMVWIKDKVSKLLGYKWAQVVRCVLLACARVCVCIYKHQVYVDNYHLDSSRCWLVHILQSRDPHMLMKLGGAVPLIESPYP